MGRGVTINGAALREEIVRRGLKVPDVSRAIGYRDDSLTQSIYNGRIDRKGVEALDTICGIAPEIYIPQKKTEIQEPEVKQETPENIGIDYARLGEIIESAVYNAVRKAWAE